MVCEYVDEIWGFDKMLWGIHTAHMPLLPVYLFILRLKSVKFHRRSSKIVDSSHRTRNFSRMLTLGSSNKISISPKLDLFHAKILLILLNQSNMESELKQLLILGLIIVLFVDPLLKSRQSRIMHISTSPLNHQ